MEIENQIRKVIAETLSVDQDKVIDSAHFADDLGADSLDTVELVMALEEQFLSDWASGFPDVEAGKVQTVGDVIQYITTVKKKS
jgi:acyl carrier protein